jgi:hypothetical protein
VDTTACARSSGAGSRTSREVYERQSVTTRSNSSFTPSLSTAAPPFVPFSEMPSIINILEQLRVSSSLSIGLVKMGIRRTMRDRIQKPHANNVEDMYWSNPDMFHGGGSPLLPESRSLDVFAMDRCHIAACSRCRTIGSVAEACYWYKLRRPIAEGWKPQIMGFPILPLYEASGIDGNHKSASIYEATVIKEIDAQVTAGICTRFDKAPQGSIISPIGVVVKNSDVTRGKVHTGITLNDQASLDMVNASLLEKGMPLIKLRPINDVTASGVNDRLLTPSFSNSGIDDAISIITPDCYMGKVDVTRYFHQFPIDPSSMWLFWFKFRTSFYRVNRVLFGAGPAPYFTNTYGAEVRKWILHAEVPLAHFCDDYFSKGNDRKEIEFRLGFISAFFILIGFLMASHKEEIGKRLVYLGVLFDSIKMIMSFEPLTAASFHSELTAALDKIKGGKHLTPGEIRHIAGKFSHLSQVCQSGRIHIRFWWAYLRHGPSLSSAGFACLFRDSEWWLHQLDIWSQGGHSGGEYPILSTSVLASDPQKVVILQSDASGPDGYGYISGYLDEVDPIYYSAQWRVGEMQLCDESSHFAELRALAHFVANTGIADKILFWVSDSQSAVYTVNKGSCYETESLDLLSSVLARCDVLHISLLAIWVPRDSNLLPDYLSHLAFNLNRSEQGGRSSNL